MTGIFLFKSEIDLKTVSLSKDEDYSSPRVSDTLAYIAETALPILLEA